MVKKKPDGNNVIPTIMVNDAAKAIELYTRAFNAKLEYRVDTHDGSGRIMHACFLIGNTRIFIGDVCPEMGNQPSVSQFYTYFDNVDEIFKQAKEAGLSEVHKIDNTFWGDRMGSLKDSFGITWTVATHVRDVSEEEIIEGAKKMSSAA